MVEPLPLISESSRSTPDLRFAVFAWLWSIAALFSLLSRWEWAWTLVYGFPSPLGLAGLLVAICAVLVLIEPASLARLSGLSLSLVFLVVVELPAVPNHRLVLAFVSICLLLAIVGAKTSGKTGTGLREEAWGRFAPSGRWVAILVYFFAFLAKLNSGFIDPAHSCAVEFYGNIRNSTGGILPDSRAMHLGVVWTTLVVEGLLPALLFFRRTRSIGVVLGVAFHLVLAFDLEKLFFNFSAVMSPLLLLFLPDRYFSNASARWRAWSEGRMVSTETVSTVSVIGILLLLAFSIMTAELPSLIDVYVTTVAIFWGVHGIIIFGTIIVFLFHGFRETREVPESDGLKIRGASQVLVLVMVILNGLSPYLGLKTRTGFNMYSNLRVEPGLSNHWFMPQSPDLLGHLEDSVRIVSTSDPQWNLLYVETGWRIPYFSLSQRVAKGIPIEVIYERNGKVFRYMTARADTEPVKPRPWILRKLLIYRPLGDGVEEMCFW